MNPDNPDQRSLPGRRAGTRGFRPLLLGPRFRAGVCTHVVLATILSRALAPLRPLAGGEGGARRGSDGRVRWVVPPLRPAGSPTSPRPSPPPRAEREALAVRCVHGVALSRGGRIWLFEGFADILGERAEAGIQGIARSARPWIPAFRLAASLRPE